MHVIWYKIVLSFSIKSMLFKVEELLILLWSTSYLNYMLLNVQKIIICMVLDHGKADKVSAWF